MTAQFGDRAAFAVEIGEALSPDLRVVDLWAAGVRITTQDDVAYVPSLVHYMRSTAVRVRQGQVRPCPFPAKSPAEVFQQLEADQTDFRERYWFMRWSEIVDNVASYAYLDDLLVIAFAFRRADPPLPEHPGTVFVARIPPEDFATIVLQAVDLLEAAPIM
ncbi:hypothetical protein [Hamadaea tsunoensis]|uniref:hypothetical protein n=1 Tax=Hamadaea tsunoensis TaxID=53368 RepID=UPI000429429B|nr:hypothetical protein [Hamadaea tsunoensis]